MLNGADIDAGNPQAAITRYSESFPEYWGDNARPLNVAITDQGIEMVRLLRATGETDKADALLGELIRVLEAAPLLAPTGSAFSLPAAYALAGRTDDAMNALRSIVDADMQKQRDNARRMQANGEMPAVPGMELLSKPEKSGAPPI